MPQRITLDFINDETGETHSVSSEFTEDELKLLETFARYAEEVWDTDFIQRGEKGRLNLHWDEEKGLSASTVLPDWNQVIVFLHKFRPILLKNEKTFFNKIHNLLAKKLDHENFRKTLKYRHEQFNGKHSQSRIQVKSNGVLLNSEEVLFDWLNSHEFHREEDKRSALEELHRMVPLDVSKVLFLGLLIDKAQASINIAELINVMLGKQDEASATMRK